MAKPVSLHFPKKLVFGDQCFGDFINYFLSLSFDKVYIVADPRVTRPLETLVCALEMEAKAVFDRFAEDYQNIHPELADFISEHAWETLGVYHVAPPAHHKRIRTTNMVERVNQELLRRSKVIRIFPNPKSCLRLFSALLKEWHEDWVSGRRYLNMDQLREWKAERAAHPQDRGPGDEQSPKKEKELTVA